MGEAEKVFDRFERESLASTDWRDKEGIAKVATGPLLAEQQAGYDRRRVSDKRVNAARFTRLVFMIPAERDQPGYPRSFAVFGKPDGRDNDPQSGVHYFVQEGPGGEWKAALASWVAAGPGFDPSGFPNASPYQPVEVKVRPTPLSAVRRDLSGAVVLSPTATADRQVCERYAEYLGTAPADGGPKGDWFAPGELTSGTVEHFKPRKSEEGTVASGYDYATSGPELPVLRLENGKALVACSLVQNERTVAAKASAYIRLGKGDPVDVLLGGKQAKWSRVDVKRSMTVLIEVPGGGGGAAEVVGCNCRDPQLLSAEGDPFE
ncbi:hypothetical protein [Streptomyces sp. NPDC090022]|uniref:hypothetical protein n=1 Tax=Streptomyces sp. NPDC090022 TaxID=3365920 RepID=UPI00381A3F29